MAPCFECQPDRSHDAVKFSANLMVPESHHSDSPTSKHFRPYSITNLPRTRVVPATVQFDRELCGRTIEIENVRVEWMLASKFVPCKISISQMPPKNALRSGCLLPQHASPVHEGSSYSLTLLPKSENNYPLTSILSPQVGARRMWLSWTLGEAGGGHACALYFRWSPKRVPTVRWSIGGSSESTNFRNRSEKTSGRSFQ